MADQQSLADYGGADIETQTSDAELTTAPEMTTPSDKTRRKNNAEALCDELATIDGVEEVIVDDATPKTWESVRIAVILPGSMGWATPTERGVQLDDSVNLRSISQRINSIVGNDDHVSSFTVIDRPEKISDTCHDVTLYLIDVWYP